MMIDSAVGKKYRKYLIGKISIIFISMIFFNVCATIESKTENIHFPVAFTDMETKTIRSFERIQHYTYWINFQLNGKNLTIESIVQEEFLKTDGAKGIKNFKVRFYSSSWNNGGGALMNFPGYAISGPLGIFGFYSKSVFVTGDIY